MEPSLLLLDEPSAGLSRDERDDLARFILRIKHELKLPMIWIEHDMQMVADLADRIHVLDYGRTLASGVPEQVLKNPAVVAAYLGCPVRADRPDHLIRPARRGSVRLISGMQMMSVRPSSSAKM